MKSLPVFPYGTRKVFLRHFEILSYASLIVDVLTLIVLASIDSPHLNEHGISSALYLSRLPIVGGASSGSCIGVHGMQICV